MFFDLPLVCGPTPLNRREVVALISDVQELICRIEYATGWAAYARMKDLEPAGCGRLARI
jgi:hypothetical protein